jgi:hypothetical protein
MILSDELVKVTNPNHHPATYADYRKLFAGDEVVYGPYAERQ